MLRIPIQFIFCMIGESDKKSPQKGRWIKFSLENDPIESPTISFRLTFHMQVSLASVQNISQTPAPK